MLLYIHLRNVTVSSSRLYILLHVHRDLLDKSVSIGLCHILLISIHQLLQPINCKAFLGDFILGICFHAQTENVHRNR